MTMAMNESDDNNSLSPVPPVVPESPSASGAPQAVSGPDTGPQPPAVKKKTAKRKPRAVEMKGNLVVVESPAKARTIEKYLGPDYFVRASMGHVRDLPRSKLGVDLEHGFAPQYLVLRDRKKLVKELQQESGRARRIYLAPDPDREGEAIAWHLSEVLTKDQGKISRVTFNEITPSAVKAAFHSPRKIDMDKVYSQQARRILDRIVGYQISPVLWKNVGSGLSAGRVQSVAVRIICDREVEINAFVPKEYWSIHARLEKPNVPESVFWAALKKIHDPGTAPGGAYKKPELGNQDDTGKIIAELQGASYVVSDVKKKERMQRPVPPFTTSLLQQAAVNRLHWSISHAMVIAQQLYEGLDMGPQGRAGLITYMRTDSFRVSKESQTEALSYIKKNFGSDYAPETPNRYRSRKSAQEAHEAIRPTSVFRTPDSVKAYLSGDQFALYKLIWERFLASQMMPARMLVTSVEITAGRFVFGAAGTEIVFPGFLAVYHITSADMPVKKSKSDESEDAQKDEEAPEEVSGKLPSLEVNDPLNLLELKPEQHFTKPPPRYSEATLVRALEELGIGRPSTYAPTIATILKRDYVHKEKGKLHPTDLGILVNKLLVKHFSEILDLQFTAQMEENLDKVEEGKTDWVSLLGDFYCGFSKTVAAATLQMKEMKPELSKTGEICERCSKPMVIRFGRFGRFVACSGYPECKNTKSLSTGVKCPKEGCGGDVVKRRSKMGRTFYGCSKYPACDYVTRALGPLKKKAEDAAEGSQADQEIPSGSPRPFGAASPPTLQWRARDDGMVGSDTTPPDGSDSPSSPGTEQ